MSTAQGTALGNDNIKKNSITLLAQKHEGNWKKNLKVILTIAIWMLYKAIF